MHLFLLLSSCPPAWSSTNQTATFCLLFVFCILVHHKAVFAHTLLQLLICSICAWRLINCVYQTGFVCLSLRRLQKMSESRHSLANLALDGRLNQIFLALLLSKQKGEWQATRSVMTNSQPGVATFSSIPPSPPPSPDPFCDSVLTLFFWNRRGFSLLWRNKVREVSYKRCFSLLLGTSSSLVFYYDIFWRSSDIWRSPNILWRSSNIV